MDATIRGWVFFAVTAAAATATDLVTKRVAFGRLGMPGTGPSWPIVPGIFAFETNLNEGALFGVGQGLGLVFATVSVVAIVGIGAMMLRRETRSDGWLVLALGLIVGGILGNLYDRVGLPGLAWHAPPERLGQPVYAVRDWIHVTVPGVIDWPIFNLADSWLVIGAGMLLVASLRPPPAATPEPEPRP